MTDEQGSEIRTRACAHGIREVEHAMNHRGACPVCDRDFIDKHAERIKELEGAVIAYQDEANKYIAMWNTGLEQLKAKDGTLFGALARFGTIISLEHGRLGSTVEESNVIKEAREARSIIEQALKGETP